MLLKLLKIVSILLVFIFATTALVELADLGVDATSESMPIHPRTSDGAFIEYFPNGKISSEEFYQSGLRYGKWRFYYRNGLIKYEFDYNQGALHGEQRYFSSTGTLIYTENYENGILASDSIINDSLYSNEIKLIDNGAIFFEEKCKNCHLSNDNKVKKSFFISENMRDQSTKDSILKNLIATHIDSLDSCRIDSLSIQLSDFQIRAVVHYIDDINKRLSVHASNKQALKKVRIRPNQKKL